MNRSARNVVVLGVWSWAACSRHEPPAEAEVAQAEVKAEPVVEVKPEPVVEVKPEPVVEVKPEPVVEPEPPPPPPPPTDGKAIEPEPGVSEWKELPGLSDVQGFHPLVFGVLAQCGLDGAQSCKLYDDGRLEISDVDLGVGAIWGTWRSDAWQVVIDERTDDEDEDERSGPAVYETIELQRWRGDSFRTEKRIENQVDPNGYDGKRERYEDSAIVRKGWAGGMLVYAGSLYTGAFIRVPLTGPPPPQAPVPKDLLDFFEAESGATLFASGDGEWLWLHPPCPAGACAEQILKLPKRDAEEDGYWELSLDVPRGGDSMTIVASDDSNDYLIHYDGPAGWSFELLPIEANEDVIWPDTRGGLWVEVGDALWYRSAAGRWFDVALPGDAIAFANRVKPREFLALVEGPDGNRVFATRGPVKAGPPPAVEPAPAIEPAPAVEPAPVEP